MKTRKEVFPRYFPDGVYPPNTILVVSRLVLPELLVEIEAMAVKPGAMNGRTRPGAPGRGARASGRRKTSRRRG
jgi:2-iminobutanoate/2-iminopropanoate deaminase